MASIWKRAKPLAVRLLSRMVIGVAIGLGIVVVVICIYYYGADSDNRFFFFDDVDTWVALLKLGAAIGAIVGLAWAINTSNGNKHDEPTNPAT
jgi:hypothetical protein